MVVAMQMALQEVPENHKHYAQARQVHAELDKHMQYFKMQGKKKMGNDIMHLQLKAAYKQDKIKLEAMIVPNTPSSLIWQNQICPLFASEAGYEQKGVEPKGDLERKIQNWVDSISKIN